MSTTTECPPGLDPAYYALSLLRRRRLDACIDHTTAAIREKQTATGGGVDLQLWWAKTRALTNQSWFDDTEMEETDAGEVLVERNVTTSAATAPRPGTSLMVTSSKGGGSTGGVARPASRAASGYARPSSRLGGPTGSRAGVQSSAGGLTSARPSTSRPITASGRFVRLGTASLAVLNADEHGSVFVDVEKLDCKKYAERPTQARVLCDYLLYHEKHTRKAAELAAEATQSNKFSDWWWKARLGKCYYYLNLSRDAEQQFRSSLKHYECVATVLELGKVMMRLDQPLALIDLLQRASETNAASTHLIIGSARLHDLLQNTERSLEYYKQALELDGGHPEGLACLASHYFHEDQPEIALRLYRRLLQMGVQTFELWNNLGLCCFYASQYDGALSYLMKALGAAKKDLEASEVWFNISHVAISLGDILMAYQALKICVSLNPKHVEALNNLGVLEMREERLEQARGDFNQAVAVDEQLHEALYNAALLHWRLGEVSEAAKQCDRALDVYPDHWESLELKKEINQKIQS